MIPNTDELLAKMQDAVRAEQSSMRLLSDAFAAEKEYQSAKDEALFDTAKMLKEINSRTDREHQEITARMDKEREERLASERKSKYITIINTLVGVFTFIATVVFGLLSLLR